MARSRPRCDIDGNVEKARLTEICHALPEVTSEGHEPHVIYTVRGRNFAYFQEDHHGDGRVALVCKAPPGENAALVATDPVRFFTPSYVGRGGWIGLRLDTGSVDWAEVAELVHDSYRLVAPKRLAREHSDKQP